jgi:hypothetical protein
VVAIGSPGFLSGNVIQVPVHIPISPVALFTGGGGGYYGGGGGGGGSVPEAQVRDQLLSIGNLLHDIVGMHKDNPKLVGIAETFHGLEHLF